MAVWLNLGRELWISRPNPDNNFVKIIEENGATFLTLKIQMDAMPIPPRPNPLPDADRINDQLMYRQSRDLADDLFEDNASIIIERFGSAPDARGSVLKLTAIISPKVPHTGSGPS